LQAAAIAALGCAPRRGALRDAATLIDENAVLLVTRRTDLMGLLRDHEWTALFVRQRAEWQEQVRPLAFGHALMDKLSAPYKGITAHALIAPLPVGAPLAAIDACLAEYLDESLSPPRLTPLPVLGIPGWADNAEAGYYDDSSVFRPPRSRAASYVQRGLG
jgi:Protein of unknown function (DUF3025)